MKPIKFRFGQSFQALAIGLGILALAGCDAGDIIDDDHAGGNGRAAEEFFFALQVRQQNRIELHGINGNVELAGVPNAEMVEIWGERRVTSKSSADARSYLANLQVRVADSDEKVFVETVQPEENEGRELEIDYHIRVPHSWGAALHNVNGNIVVDSLGQALAVVLTNGNIIARAITGNVSSTLTNGNVVLNGVQGGAEVALTNGTVSARVVLPLRAACNVNTVNGAIDLQIPRSTSAEFSASLCNGTISMTDLILHNASSSRTSMRGRLGEGAGEIALQTVTGDIQVRGF